MTSDISINIPSKLQVSDFINDFASGYIILIPNEKNIKFNDNYFYFYSNIFFIYGNVLELYYNGLNALNINIKF